MFSSTDTGVPFSARRSMSNAAVIDLAGRLDLVTLAAVLARLDLYVTGDTGPMHVAAAVGTPPAVQVTPSPSPQPAPSAPESPSSTSAPSGSRMFHVKHRESLDSQERLFHVEQ